MKLVNYPYSLDEMLDISTKETTIDEKLPRVVYIRKGTSNFRNYFLCGLWNGKNTKYVLLPNIPFYDGFLHWVVDIPLERYKIYCMIGDIPSQIYFRSKPKLKILRKTVFDVIPFFEGYGLLELIELFYFEKEMSYILKDVRGKYFKLLKRDISLQCSDLLNIISHLISKDRTFKLSSSDIPVQVII